MQRNTLRLSLLAFSVGAIFFTLSSVAQGNGSRWLPGTLLAGAGAMLCDTQKQIETLLTRVLSGVPGPKALADVNQEARKADACGYVPAVNLKIVRVVHTTKAFQKKNGLFYHFDILEVEVVDFGGVVQFLAAHDPSVYPYYEVRHSDKRRLSAKEGAWMRVQ